MISFGFRYDRFVIFLFVLTFFAALFITTLSTSSALAKSDQSSSMMLPDDDVAQGRPLMETTETTPTLTAAAATLTAAATSTLTTTATAATTATPTSSATATATPTGAATSTVTATPTVSPTPSRSSTPTATVPPSPTATPIVQSKPPAYTRSYASCLWFTETAGGQGGFSVCDDLNANFRTAFYAYGLRRVGYPISSRFERDGFIMQAFQKGVFQWRSSNDDLILTDQQTIENNTLQWHDGRYYTTFVNLFDELHQKGLDDQLQARHHVPLELDRSSEGPLSFEQLVHKRQALLDTRPALRQAYFSARDPLVTFGLPTSKVEDMGSHYAIRLQRAVLQEWKFAVPWAEAGFVTIANSGDIAKRFNYLPAQSLIPEAAPFDSAANAPDSLKIAMNVYQVRRETVDPIPVLQEVLDDASISAWHDEAKGALATSYCQAGQYNAAIRSAIELLIDYPDSDWRAEARAVLVASYYQQGNYEEAWHAWSQLRIGFPTSPWADDEGLGRLLRNVCNANPSAVGGIFFYPSVNYQQLATRFSAPFRERNSASNADAAFLFQQAMSYYKQERYSDAFSPLQLLIDTYPEDKWGRAARYFWADTFVQLNSYYATAGCTTKFVVGYHDESQINELIEQAACLGNAGNQVGEANTLQNVGSLYFAQGKYDQARECYQQAFKIWHKLGNTIRAGTILHDLAVIYEVEGEDERALRNYEHALHTLRQTPNVWHLEAQMSSAYTINKIGHWHEVHGNHEKARALYQETLGAWEDIERHGINVGTQKIETWRNIGASYHTQTDYDAARDAYGMALQILQEEGANIEEIEEAKTLNYLGALSQAQGYHSTTVQLYRQSLALWNKNSQSATKERINTLNQLGLHYYGQEQYAQALVYHRQALDLAQTQQDTYAQGLAWQYIGMVHQAQGQSTQAQADYQRALTQWSSAQPRDVRFEHTVQVPFFSGLTYQHYGRHMFATQSMNQPLAVRFLAIPRAGEATTHSNLGAFYAAQQDLSNAQASYERARDLQEAFGDVPGATITTTTFERLTGQPNFEAPTVPNPVLPDPVCVQNDPILCNQS